VQAPAGAGKTFVALHQMLKALKDEGNGGSILFVARNPALCLFVAKWMNERLAKKVSGFGDRRRSQMISRLHMLCHPLESGPRSISIEDSRVNFIIGGEVGSSYSLLVVDEVSKK